MDDLDGVEFLTIEVAARLISVSVPTMRRWVRAGTLKAYRLPGGRELRFAKDDVLALLSVDTDEARAAADPGTLRQSESEGRPEQGRPSVGKRKRIGAQAQTDSTTTPADGQPARRRPRH